MIQVPRVISRNVGPYLGGNDDDLARLEAYRDELRSTIASEERMAKDLVFSLRLVMVAVLAGMGLLLFLAEYISIIGLVWTVVIGATLIFILTLKVHIFGEPHVIGILAGHVLLGLGGDGAAATAFAPTSTGPTIRDLLAECETKISRLKDNRS